MSSRSVTKILKCWAFEDIVAFNKY